MTSDNTGQQRKKVLVLTSTFPRWEGDNEPPFVFELCRRLSADFDVWVLAPHAPCAETRETLSGLTVVRFRYFFEWGETLAYRGGILANLRSNRLCYLLVPLFLVCQLTVLLRLLARERFDIVHAHWLIPQGLVAVAARLLSRQAPALLCTAHGSDLHGLRGRLFSALKRLVMRRSDTVSMVSQAMKEHAVALGAEPEKISIISMGVDTANTFTPAEHPTQRNNELLFVGRLTAQKGLESLVRALPQVVSACPDTILTVIGRGPQEEPLRALSKALGVARNVSFLGAVANENLPELYRRASILVFPSATDEGFGLVCVEALACECPVIASDLPAVRELILNGETGLLFKRGDGDELAHKILTLLADPTLRHSLGKAGRKFVSQRFDWQIVAQRYGDLLTRSIAIKA
ncbi:MAG TPA: glycosyltransferase family 4 protein [Sulfuricella sp.]|nr:glycosyltransferase family 4 protein [Sulfuricella sp.]